MAGIIRDLEAKEKSDSDGALEVKFESLGNAIKRRLLNYLIKVSLLLCANLNHSSSTFLE